MKVSSCGLLFHLIQLSIEHSSPDSLRCGPNTMDFAVKPIDNHCP